MPHITVQFKGKVLQEYPIAMGQTVTIGRKESNDIIIDNLAVSGEHAKIESVSATFIVTDLQSTNGTFVNRELISAHGLRNKDVILIGKHELLFDRSDLDEQARAANAMTDDEKTRHLDTAEYRDLINKSAEKKQPQTAPGPSAPPQKKDTSFLSRIVRFLFG